MKITVWSILSGRLSGHLVLHLPPTHTLKKVLEAYCTHKGASVSAEYVMRNRDNHILSLNKTLRQAGLENGDTLMIGLLSDEKQTFSFGSWYFVTFAAFIIGILGLGCVVWLCVQVLPSPRQSKTGITSDLKIRIFVLLHRYRQRQILPLSESITPWAMPIRRKTS
ncbi:hypothetical protein GWK47_011008 [Chionoecetes opilio]|uniref:TUG ubiquitin-like domain-containing protein n=1 Tax=Chionoecetes opilio TaxID=41210 RepID=A0A8J4Y326_CHIOP|nr:hypothetical protein GWK47_011008 [Chionoecetes opilio]